MFNLDGKVALVTGASKGLGREISLALGKAGADLVLCSRSLSGLRETESILKDEGLRSLVLDGDVSNRTDVEKVVTKTIAEFGKIDILINNAAVNVRHPFEDFDDEDWFKIINTNLTGPFFCIRAVIPYMKEQKWGRIINLGSMLGIIALPQRAAYCSSKAGLHALTKVAALELAGFNINVNAIAAGPHLTEINQVVIDDPVSNKYFIDRIPVGQWGQPKDLGSLVLYLASEESKFMTGSIISYDGGWTAQ